MKNFKKLTWLALPLTLGLFVACGDDDSNADPTGGTSSEGGKPLVRATQGGYATASLREGYRISPQWSAALNVTNLFDRSYYTRLGSGGFGPANFGNVYGEPRNVQVSLRGRF